MVFDQKLDLVVVDIVCESVSYCPQWPPFGEGARLRSAHPGMDLCLRVSPYFITGELTKHGFYNGRRGSWRGQVESASQAPEYKRGPMR